MLTPRLQKINPSTESRNQVLGRYPATIQDLFNFCLQPIQSVDLHTIIQLPDLIDFECLCSAVRLIFTVEPIIQCGFVAHWFRPYWQQRQDLCKLEKLCVLIETTNVETNLMQFLTDPLDPVLDPLVQVRIFRQSLTGRDTIVIKISHTVVDAAGMKNFVYYLASFYNQLIDNDEVPPTRNKFYSRSLSQVIQQFGWLDRGRILYRSWLDRKRRSGIRSHWNFPNLDQNKDGKLYLFLHLPVEHFQRLKNYGRQCQATLNDLLLTAYFRAIYVHIPYTGDGVLPVVSTIDLRRYLPSRHAAALCNLSGLATLLIDFKLNESFAETLISVRTQMQFLKSNYLGLYMIPPMAMFFNGLPFSWCQYIFTSSLERKTNNQSIPPILTNMGLVEGSKLQFGSVEPEQVFLTPPIQYSPFFMMGVSSFQQVLTLSVGFCQSRISSMKVQAILDHMYDELILL